MLKLIINNDEQHPLPIIDLNYNSNFEIDQFQLHTDEAFFKIQGTTLNDLKYFENKQITNIKIFNPDEELVMNLSFGENTYMTNFKIKSFQDFLITEVFFEPMSSK